MENLTQYNDNFLGGVGDWIENAFNNAKDLIGDTAGKVFKEAKFAPLLPFKGAMKKALKKRRVTLRSNKLSEIATKFYNYVVKKKSDPLISSYSHDPNYSHLDPAIVSLIVTAILAFFKQLKQKKANNEPLSPTENMLANELSAIEDEIRGATFQSVRDDAKMELGNLFPVILVVIAAVVLIKFFK
jgi:hypothetical protein